MQKISFYLFSALVTSLSLNSFANEGAKAFSDGVLECLPNLTTPSNAEIKLSAHTDRLSYQLGDLLTLKVKPSADVYISVLDHGSDPAKPHRAQPLFSNVFVQGETTYIFPPPNGDQLKIEPPAGTNTLEVIASRSPLQQAEAGSKNVGLISSRDAAALKDQTAATSNCILGFEIKP